MTNSKMEIIGAAEIERRLREFGPMIQGKKGYPQNPLRNAARAMANKAKDKAKARVPVDTGRLRDAIAIKLLSAKYRDTITIKGDSVEFYYLGVNPGKTRDDPKGAWYYKFVEKGTTKMPARPFLRPAVEENVSQLVNVFEGKLSKDLVKIANKLNSSGVKIS